MRVLAASILLLWSSTAAAQGREALAQRRFEDGLAAREAGEHASALEAFEASNELFPSPNSRLMVARSLRDLGRLAEAWGEYRLAAARARERADHDPRYAATADAAASEGAALSNSISRVRVELRGAPDTATVEVQGRSFPSVALGDDIAVDPGSVAVRVSAPGYLDAEGSVTVAAGARAVVELELTRAPTAEPRPPEAARGDTFVYEALGWTSAGVAIAATGLFALFYALAQDRYDSATLACAGTGGCPASVQVTLDEGRAFEAATNGSWIGALGFGALGVTFLLLSVM